MLLLKVAANGTAAAAKKLVYPAGNGAVPAVTDADVKDGFMLLQTAGKALFQ